ncbi:MAG: DUF1579 family protein [Planctomycetota bacterium]
MTEDPFLTKLVGDWAGSCQTWFEPGALADTSEVTGTFSLLLGGRMIRHTYEGTLCGEHRFGEAWLARNGVTGEYQASWIDNHHMNDAVMFSVGQATEQGCSILGRYDTYEGPPWGWRTDYELQGGDRLLITAYNIPPGGEPAKAIELVYGRVGAV